MKRSLVFLAAFIVFASCDEEVSTFIVNGRNASIEEFPYMAGVFTRGWFTCGGAILNSRTILTAAHCIFVTDPADLSISVGSTTRLNGTMYVASRITRHPDYVHIPSPFKMIADIAVVRTRNRIRFGARVQSIPLGHEPLSSFSRVMLTGWGQKVNSGQHANHLQQLRVTSIPNIQCALNFRSLNLTGAVKEESLCLVAPGDRGTCGGDSGGPAVHDGVVVGVCSWSGRPCGSYPSVYMRTENHLAWIRRQMLAVPFDG